MNKGPRIGLLQYKNSYNLGDEIQSIAVRQYLPEVDCYIDRDTFETSYTPSDAIPESTCKSLCNAVRNTLCKTKIVPVKSEEEINLVINGWFDSAYCKFPPPGYITPLFISFHLNDTDHSKDPTYAYLEAGKGEKSNISDNPYLKNFTVGCRDWHTVDLLRKNNVQAYFSGCVTLTLENKFTTRTDEILAVDCHTTCPSLYKLLVPEEIRNKAEILTHLVKSKLPHEVKTDKAQALLDRYAVAKLVITSRLHCALPCLALGTPVVLIHPNLADPRLQTYLKYMKSYTTGDTWDVPNDYKNPYSEELESIKSGLRKNIRNWVNGIDVSIPIGETCTRKGISIVAVAMNRSEYLKKSLPSWIAANPNEIVIVDWGSTDDDLSVLASGIVRVIKVSNVQTWSLTKSYNLGFRYASYDCVLKVDADTILSPDFFSYHSLTSTSFFSGDWKHARNPNETHLNGVVYVNRSAFFRVNGYNELLSSYGYDDSDLYERLEKNGMKKLLINLDKVHHTPHPDTLRVQNTTSKLTLDVEIEKNRLICNTVKWDGVLSTFEIDGPNVKYIQGPMLDSEIETKLIEKAIQNRKYAKYNNRKILYVQPKNGIGNRLRCLASAWTIAKAVNRKLVIVWLKDIHCEAVVTDLFQLNHLFKDVTITDSVCKYAKNIDYYNYAELQGKYINDESSNDIYIESACVLNNQHTNWQKEAIFLRSLQPVHAITSVIHHYEKKFGDMSEYIGVHIRMGQDPTLYKFEDTTTYSSGSKSSIEKWRSASHWSIFVQKMRDDKNKKYFVSCDSEEAYRGIAVCTDLTIRTTSRAYFDRSKEQVQSGLVDLILLSKCSGILGSQWSSFTEVAHKLCGRYVKLAGVDF